MLKQKKSINKIKAIFFLLKITFIKSLCGSILLFNLFVLNSYAEDLKDQIIDILTNLNCQTQGVGDLLRTQFSHTCQTTLMADMVLANIVAPLTYADMMLRLKINDNDLFPEGCTRENRIEPNDIKITFGVCSNLELMEIRAEAVAEATLAIAEAIVDNSDPWPKIAKIWVNKKSSFHDIYTDKKVGDNGIITDLPPSFPFLPWKVVQVSDRICIATNDITLNWIPVGCKYIKEPFPQSIYASFMDPQGLDPSPTASIDPRMMTICNGLENGGCYQRIQAAARAGTIITSPIIECIQQMLLQLMVSREVCKLSDIDKVTASGDKETSSFFLFQRNMQRLVISFITLYVMFFAGNMLLSPQTVNRVDLISFVIKIFLVTYFSVGINVRGGDSGQRYDGITQMVLPLLLSGIQSFASWIMSASTNGLCVFDIKEYSESMSYLALWDAIDCRVSHYLGLDMLRTMMVENMSRHHDFSKFDFFNFSIPPYYFLLIPAIIMGEPTLISLALMYPMLVITIVAYLVNATVVCLMGIVILTFLAPLFVPMYLFNYTRGYFMNWVSLLISYMLQPMVVVTFIIILFTVYDYGFYGKCKYISREITYTQDMYSSNGRQNKIFFVDSDWTHYQADEMDSCQNSLGYMLNNPLATMYDINQKTVEGAVGKPNTNTASFMSKFDFLGGLTFGPGTFITKIKVIYEKLRKVIISLLVACFSLYLMHHFSEQISEFVADLVLGVSLSSTTINPKAAFDKGMALVSAAGAAATGGGGGNGGGGGGATGTNPNNPLGSGSKDAFGKAVGSGNKLRPTINDLSEKIIKDGTSNNDVAQNTTEKKIKFLSGGTSNNDEALSDKKIDLSGTGKIIGSDTDSLRNSSIQDNIYSSIEKTMKLMGSDSIDAKTRQQAENSYREYIKQLLSTDNAKGKEASLLKEIEDNAPSSSIKKVYEINKDILNNLNKEVPSKEAPTKEVPSKNEGSDET